MLIRKLYYSVKISLANSKRD